MVAQAAAALNSTRPLPILVRAAFSFYVHSVARDFFLSGAGSHVAANGRWLGRRSSRPWRGS